MVVSSGEIWVTEGFQPEINLSQNICLLLLNFVSGECIIEVKQKRRI